MRKYSDMIRTTLGSYISDSGNLHCGVYVLACYPQLGCLYVGISDDVYTRLRQHLASSTPLAGFLAANMADAYGFRLDVLTAPGNNREWMIEAERRLVHALRPMFNEQHLGE